ncbi:integrase domain-containing protein [Ideonella sp. 4Y11]|uniref:Integrase domain-containing protein n=1 Tax=Ideonella aquatica TaxID=2824119 RepID=A0A940YKJ0_9BURK|nr:phage integrase N-terminal domain-containing protein [Ideonella aquatica]MBN8489327.1 integrase domain-containing protein [Burkholderiales bacterium]MBQ0957713.1 integrase domain-containing protein [Ideonella aquatica]
MKNLNFQLRQLSARNRDGSHATQANRERMLSLIAHQLDALGYRDLHADNLREKHVAALVSHWTESGISAATIKNRLAAVRWWAEKIGKANVVARDNATLGVERRSYVTNEDKAKSLTEAQLERVSSAHVLASLALQAAFGLRREESLKIRPDLADGGNVLRLQGSWTKGGRPREVPIVNEAQRQVLEQAKDLAGKGSLIPEGLTYREHLASFRAQCQRAGINGVHGLRHRYAQERYEAKTGWKAPAAGGPTRRELSGEQRSVDARARLEISLELGHAREQIVAIYLGR